MVRIILVLWGLVSWTAYPALADEHRQLGAHVHGHGKLNIAIEGKSISLELDVPAADIVGFEHEPKTPEEKAALELAKARLASGLSLFTPSAEAQCAQKNAAVGMEAEHGAENDQHAPGGKHEEHVHADFNAEYTFECAAPSQLKSMAFGYFVAFPNAQELDISIISPKGQTSYQVTRQKPVLDMTGIM